MTNRSSLKSHAVRFNLTAETTTISKHCNFKEFYKLDVPKAENITKTSLETTQVLNYHVFVVAPQSTSGAPDPNLFLHIHDDTRPD
jgi:hypothetical protein